MHGKRICLVLCCMLMCISTCLAQDKVFKSDYRAVYKMSFVADSLKPENVEEEYAELLINGDHSIFRTVAQGVIDSAIYTALQQGSKPENNMTLYINNKTKFQYSIWKSTDKVIYFDQIYPGFTDFYYYEEAVDKQNWQILDDTVSINGYLCQKATMQYGNRKWTALFAPSIPISSGPYKFAGLPGLILYVADEKEQWKFELTALTKKRTISPYTDTRFRYAEMDREKFYSERKRFRDNAFEIETASGANDGVNESGMKRIKEFYKKRAISDNNWIELYP